MLYHRARLLFCETGRQAGRLQQTEESLGAAGGHGQDDGKLLRISSTCVASCSCTLRMRKSQTCSLSSKGARRRKQTPSPTTCLCLTGKLCRQSVVRPTSTKDGLPKSNEFNPVHSRKDAFLSSKALCAAGYSLLIFKWYVCGFDTDVHQSRPYEYLFDVHQTSQTTATSSPTPRPQFAPCPYHTPLK